jgi:ADP-ribosylglycohydrolase
MMVHCMGSPEAANLRDRLTGTLLGTAVGDALGLPCEGMRAQAIARRFGPVERYHLLGRTGFVSDDTEQAALVAQSLARHPDDPEACALDFRHALLGWFLRLPWGIGLATVRASLRIAVGLRRSGVPSAGNGAAMRAAILGAFFRDLPEERRAFGTAIAQVTHTDRRAVEAAFYVAEVAAACARSSSDTPPSACCDSALPVVTESALLERLQQAQALAAREADTSEAARCLGSTGFAPHTVAFATFCFLRFGTEPLRALTEAIRAGGDTDSIAAIVGAWTGALHGESTLPQPLLQHLHDGPFGPTHLRALADCLARRRAGELAPIPGYSAPAALARNLVLYPVVLAHGFRRLLPF